MKCVTEPYYLSKLRDRLTTGITLTQSILRFDPIASRYRRLRRSRRSGRFRNRLWSRLSSGRLSVDDLRSGTKYRVSIITCNNEDKCPYANSADARGERGRASVNVRRVAKARKRRVRFMRAIVIVKKIVVKVLKNEWGSTERQAQL